jgi:hypothetical protein
MQYAGRLSDLRKSSIALITAAKCASGRVVSCKVRVRFNMYVF